MGMAKHEGATTAWGRTIPAATATRYGIVRLPGWTGPTYLSERGADRRLPGVPSSMTARELVKARHVECMFWGCGPYNHVRGGAHRHATFVHDEGKSFHGHAEHPETADHLHSKAALLEWVRSAYPDDVVDFDLDTKNIAISVEGGTSRAQRPDAWVKLSSGAQIAIEFQHSAGDFDRVQEKTSRYEQQGITVWWVFSGRSPDTCRNVLPAPVRTKFGDLTADLTPAQISLAGQATPFFWFDVERRRIATPMVPTRRWFRRLSEEVWLQEHEMRTITAYWGPPLEGYSRWARMYEHDLAQCQVDLVTGRLVTPGTQVWARDSKRAVTEIATLRRAAHQRYFDACVESEDDGLPLSSGPMDDDSSSIATQPETAVQDDELSVSTTTPSPSDSSGQVPASPPEVEPVQTSGDTRAREAAQRDELSELAGNPRSVPRDPAPPVPSERRSWWQRAWQWFSS